MKSFLPKIFCTLRTANQLNNLFFSEHSFFLNVFFIIFTFLGTYVLSRFGSQYASCKTGVGTRRYCGVFCSCNLRGFFATRDSRGNRLIVIPSFHHTPYLYSFHLLAVLFSPHPIVLIIVCFLGGFAPPPPPCPLLCS